MRCPSLRLKVVKDVMEKKQERMQEFIHHYDVRIYRKMRYSLDSF